MSIDTQIKAESTQGFIPFRSLAADIAGVLIPLAILGAGAGILVYSFVNRPAQETTPEIKTAPKVQTISAMPHTENVEIQVDGVVVPHRVIQLPTEVGGRIISRAEHCRVGKFVKAGETLFAIDPLDYQLEVKRLEQERDQAKLRIDETNVDIANTKQLLELAERDVILQEKDVTRMIGLSGQGAVAKSELDRSLRGQVTARNALQSLRNRQSLLAAQLKSAESAVELSKTKLAVAKLNVDRTKIKSPIDGVVVEEPAEVDNFVQKGATLVTIEDTSAVDVVCNLRTDQIGWLWRVAGLSKLPTGGEYELPPVPTDIVFRADDNEYVWQGVVSGYDGIGLNPRTRTVPCRILVADPTAVTRRSTETTFQAEPHNARTEGTEKARFGGPSALVRGMFVHVRIQLPTREDDLLRVPIEAMRPGGMLWVVKDAKLDVRVANVAKTLADHVLIRRVGSDIEPDDRIIVTPLPAATEGMEVEEVAAR